MLAPWKKSYDQARQHVKKQRRFFANKRPSSQGYDFSSSHIWMWVLDCRESKLWCWRRLLRIPWTARRFNKSIVKEISPGCSLEGLMLKLKLQSFGYLTHLKRLWCWERLKAGGEGDDRGWDGWMASPTQWTWVLVNSGSWWWTGKPGVLQPMGSQRVGHSWVTELYWTTGVAQLDDNSLSLKMEKQVPTFLTTNEQAQFIVWKDFLMIRSPPQE